MKGNGIVKLIKLLLLRLGLWVPLAYSLLFLFVMLITGTALSSVSGLFWVGFVVSLVFGVTSIVWFNLKRIGKRDKEEKQTRFIPADEKKEEEQGFTEGVSTHPGVVTKEGAPAPQRLFPTNEEIEREEQRRYEEPDRAVNYSREDLFEDNSFARKDAPIERTFERVSEKPRIFKTRMDESMLIYEYSDRLEFYRMGERGLTLLSTEYKQR